MADVKKIGEYNIKDETARNNVNAINETLSSQSQSISNLQENISDLTTAINQKGTQISGLDTRITALEGSSSGLTMNYHSDTETITFD